MRHTSGGGSDQYNMKKLVAKTRKKNPLPKNMGILSKHYPALHAALLVLLLEVLADIGSGGSKRV